MNSGTIKLWAYGVDDLAHFFGMTPNAIRIAIHRKKLDPANLESVMDFREQRKRL